MVHVTADFTPPVVSVLADDVALAPAARYATAPRIAISATDVNGATLRVTLDGSSVTLPIASITDGGHTLTVVARDGAGNESRVDRSFVVGSLSSGGACRISGFDPENNSAVFADSVRVTGRAAGATNVLVNGVLAHFADGSFCTPGSAAAGAQRPACRVRRRERCRHRDSRRADDLPRQRGFHLDRIATQRIGVDCSGGDRQRHRRRRSGLRRCQRHAVYGGR